MCILTMHRFLCDYVLAKEGTYLMRYEKLRVEARFFIYFAAHRDPFDEILAPRRLRMVRASAR